MVLEDDQEGFFKQSQKQGVVLVEEPYPLKNRVLWDYGLGIEIFDDWEESISKRIFVWDFLLGIEQVAMGR